MLSKYRRSAVLGTLRFTICLASCLGFARGALAELPSIRFDRLHPIGAAAGSSVEVEITGRDTEEVNSLRFDRPGLSAELLKPGQFKLTVGAEVPEGTYDVRLVGRFGISNSRLFAVTHGLQDVAETEPNNTPKAAQMVLLNSAVNGMSDGNGQDCFRFALKKGERITIDCQAQKLDSQMDATLILGTGDGEILANSSDYHGRDPFLDFIAPSAAAYFVIVHDLSYRGGFPYRLLITNRPHLETVFPRAAEPGKPTEFTAFGRNLLSLGGQVSAASIGGLPLDEFKFTLTPPADLIAEARYEFLEHPTDHSVLPTAATCTLNGFQIRAPLGGGALHPVSIVAAGGPVTLEIEPNNDKEHPQPLQLPATVSGRCNQPRDADWYTFEAIEPGTHWVEVFSERIAGRADPYVAIIDDQGNKVGEFDDYGHRLSAFDGHLRDPYGSVELQSKRKYRLLVQDRYNRGGPRFNYVLTLGRAVPNFHAAAIHSENPGPSGTNLWRGGAQFLDVVFHQAHGFNSPITITAEGLPPGVHAAPTIVPNNSRGVFVLWCDPDAPETTAPIRLFATGAQGPTGSVLRHEIRPYTRVWSEANIGSSRPMRELAVGVRNKAPYSLKIVPDKITVQAGKKVEVKLVATRYWPDFKGKITAIPLAFPGNVNMATTDIAAEATEITLSIDIAGNTQPADYTFTVLGQAQVPYAKDSKADNRPNTLVSMPSQPVTISVLAPAK